MARAITVISTVWLEILRAQGRPMKYADLARALPELPHGLRSRALTVGYRLGYLTRAGRKPYEYCVTPGCNVPPGVPLYEVLEATA